MIHILRTPHLVPWDAQRHQVSPKCVESAAGGASGIKYRGVHSVTDKLVQVADGEDLLRLPVRYVYGEALLDAHHDFDGVETHGGILTGFTAGESASAVYWPDERSKMPALTEDQIYTPGDARLAMQAVLRAADVLNISRSKLGAILGVSPAALARSASGKASIDPAGEPGELTLHFLFLYRSLMSLVGNDPSKARMWMSAENSALGGIPAQLITRADGLRRVADYLDAMRSSTTPPVP